MIEVKRRDTALMTQPHSPTVRGRKLAAELRRLREEAGLTIDEAAGLLRFSRSKVSRIEGTKTKPSRADVITMLELYGDGGRRAALLDLYENSWRRGWWQDYSDVFRGSYVAQEDDASSIHEWSPQLVPGLLQTEAYARAVTRASLRGDDAAVQRHVMARMTRAVLLGRTDPPAPELCVVIDEAALRRPIGSEDVMRGQRTALMDASHRPNVTIQVLPFGVGAHAGLGGAFIVLGFADDIAPDIGYVETRIGDAYAEDAAAVRRLRLDFEDLQSAALTPEDSREFIAAPT